MSTDFDQEPTIPTQEIERRGEPRGVRSGLYVVLPGFHRYEALEASRLGFFVAVDDPEQFRLGDGHDVSIEYGDHALTCRVEVVRKEIDPRCGVALRIAHITPVGDETLRHILEQS